MLNKQSLPINFAEGLDTKTDPKQVQAGKFLSLENSVFTKAGLLQKRNGFPQLSSLPNSTSSYLTTFNSNLTAIGPSISAFNEGTNTWVSKGQTFPLELSTLPLIRNNLNQIQADTAIAPNGLVCTVYSEENNSTITHKYAIADSSTGQNIVAPQPIPISSGAIQGGVRVFLLANFFVIIFTNHITTVNHLQYVAVSTSDPTRVTANTDIAASYVPSSTLSWDGAVTNDKLFVAYNTLSGGQSIKVTFLTPGSVSMGGGPATPVSFSNIATMVSVCVDETNALNPVIWVSFYDLLSTSGYSLALTQTLTTVLAPTQIISSGTVLNIAAVAQNAICTTYYEVSHAYSYDSSVPTNFINAITCTQAGTVGSPIVSIRSLGLASKAFLVNGIQYYLGVYQNVVGTPYQNNSNYQPTYFLIDGSTSTSASPVVVSKLAYSNGSGYYTIGLPSVSLNNGVAQVAYLFKDSISAVNKITAPDAGTQVAGVYSQTGINLVSFRLNSANIDTAEIGQDLHLSGGFLWMYDGYLPVEHNFFLWPDNVEATWSTSGGAIHAQPDGSTNTNAYWYQVTYEWTDNQGNAFRSAPSIPISVTTTGSGTAGSITVNVPYLRLTYKTANPIKIVIYRWSVAQQVYYQVTSLTAPTLNDTTADSVAFVDTLADASILGNNILYTTGGVLEDIGAPSTNIMALFDTRLWMVDAEDKNLLWFSKQVIEATPVEMSDLLTYYIAPSIGVQGSTGPITALGVMDDKLIVFKQNSAIYYINGSGPDNTGANSQYSQPIFVTSSVSSSNQQSLVVIPQGLMFQSNKGIWLLERDLSTQYIGAPVEQYNSNTVLSAVNIPQTNQVRFTLDNGVTLMYDYFYGQWGTFTGIPGISSTTYKFAHTYINSSGLVFQESPGTYLDGSNPVLMQFTTSWLNLAGLQGYQRAYFFYILGQYLSPHKLQLGIAYDYNPAPSQSTLIQPDNYSAKFGTGDQNNPYGEDNPYGGTGDLERWRVFLSRQRCQAFQVSLQEVFDASFGTIAGAGLTISGLNLIVSIKSRFRPTAAANSAGGNST